MCDTDVGVPWGILDVPCKDPRAFDSTGFDDLIAASAREPRVPRREAEPILLVPGGTATAAVAPCPRGGPS